MPWTTIEDIYKGTCADLAIRNSVLLSRIQVGVCFMLTICLLYCIY